MSEDMMIKLVEKEHNVKVLDMHMEDGKITCWLEGTINVVTINGKFVYDEEE